MMTHIQTALSSFTLALVTGKSSFEYCLKEFVLTVFHEVMHVLCPDIDEFVPYAERLLAEIIEG